MFKVAIITRTKNRILFLKRTLEDIANQNYKNFIWVIINDGGSADDLNEVIDSAKIYNIQTLFLNLNESFGMEAASNYGLSMVESEYVVIHDDDDSWNSDFLSRTVQFLDENNNYAGVITFSNLVFEKVVDDNIVIIEEQPYNHNIKAIYISEMVKGNFFPPISFLFRRSSLIKVGMFDNNLPVRGDWDFNLRFLMFYNIGLIKKPLANWHHRVKGDKYSNTINGQKNLHDEYDAIIRNKYLREDINENKVGLGFLLNIFNKQIVFSKTEDSLKNKIFMSLKKLLFNRNV